MQQTNQVVGTNFQILTVRPFQNKREALDYLAMLDNDDEVFQELNMDITDIFLISPSNLQLLIKESNVKEYVQFYRSVYE